jgi:DNA-binding CsgD family transcriptional regulator
MGLVALQPSDTQEASVPIDLSTREWQLLDAMRAGKSSGEIAQEWGTSRQNVGNIIDSLRDKGVISRRPGVPLSYASAYPWVVADGLDVRYMPALPPDAELRARYATDSRSDKTVPPIRLVRWEPGGWTFQGIPVLRADGVRPSLARPDQMLVWCVRDVEGDADAQSWAFPARLRQRWHETQTVFEFESRPSPKYRLRLSPELRRDLTECIAAVLAVDPVMDLSVPTPRPTVIEVPFSHADPR